MKNVVSDAERIQQPLPQPIPLAAPSATTTVIGSERGGDSNVTESIGSVLARFNDMQVLSKFGGLLYYRGRGSIIGGGGIFDR